MPPRPIRLAARAAALALTALPVLPATAARAADGPWSAAPASGGAGRPYFYLEGAPGSVLEDRLALTNPTGRPLTLRLRGAPADGGGPRAGGDPWLALAVPEVRVPPRTRAEVPFAVTVPATAPPGDRASALVVSGDGRESTVRLRVRVAGPTLAALTVEDVHLDKARSRIRYALVNRGNTTLAPRLEVRSDGLLGAASHHPARPLAVELAPGRRVELTEPWHPPAVDRVRVRLTVTAAGGARGEASASAVCVPGTLVAGAGAGALAAGAGGALWWARRRRARPGPVPPAAAQAAPGPVTTGAVS
ncbi:hypothetical protein [Streptomyces sp. cg36]|uniref:COG1470 family protein n=1 Tax=Streptomyces sp. cg36 TaxID=3238798 RepID=UPI0034E1EAB5